jgi:hypothetical protein
MNCPIIANTVYTMLKLEMSLLLILDVVDLFIRCITVWIIKVKGKGKVVPVFS